MYDYDYEPPQRSRPQRNWPAMVIFVSSIVFIGLAIWWMESRFGAEFAMAVAGSLVGALILGWGISLNQRNTQSTLNSAAMFNRDLAMTEKARQGTYRVMAQSERDAFNARARIDLIDVKRVDQLAQQRARILAPPDQQRPQQAPAWLLDEDADGEPADARWYE